MPRDCNVKCGKGITYLKFDVFPLQRYDLHGGLVPHLNCATFFGFVRSKFKKKEGPTYA